MAKMIITIRFRWWLKYYLAGVIFTARLTGLAPDPVKVERWVARGIYFE